MAGSSVHSSEYYVDKIQEMNTFALHGLAVDERMCSVAHIVSTGSLNLQQHLSKRTLHSGFDRRLRIEVQH